MVVILKSYFKYGTLAYRLQRGQVTSLSDRSHPDPNLLVGRRWAATLTPTLYCLPVVSVGKTAGEMMGDLRYVEGTTLMAESEEELKSL